MYQLK